MEVGNDLTRPDKKSAAGHQRFTVIVVSRDCNHEGLNASDELRKCFLGLDGVKREEADSDQQQLGEDAFEHGFQL